MIFISTDMVYRQISLAALTQSSMVLSKPCSEEDLPSSTVHGLRPTCNVCCDCGDDGGGGYDDDDELCDLTWDHSSWVFTEMCIQACHVLFSSGVVVTFWVFSGSLWFACLASICYCLHPEMTWPSIVLQVFASGLVHRSIKTLPVASWTLIVGILAHF